MACVKKIYHKFFPKASWAHRIFWHYRHGISSPNLTEESIADDLNHPHRKFLLEVFSQFKTVSSLLELGCSWGPNLLVLNKKFSKIEYSGFDIRKNMIKYGIKFLQKKNIKNIHLQCNDIFKLSKIPDNTYDVVLTDATMIYVDNKHIDKVALELVRIAKYGILLSEFDDNSKNAKGMEFESNWIRDYKSLFESYASEIIKIPYNDEICTGKWAKYGQIVKNHFK